MHIASFRTASLGDTSYLLTHGGHGIVVDPQRDVRRFLDAIDEQGVTVTHVLDTHVHNDYLSGAPALAKHLHADLVLPAAAGATYPFVPAFHMEDLPGEAGMAIRPIHTPGHTPEHTSYLVVIDGHPVAVFTGGSLLVGSAGRSDLLGMQFADSLARLQYRSVSRLARLPGSVEVLPTHGEGSFCTASGAGRTTSTIEQERLSNPVLAYPNEDAFVKGELGSLLPYPDYYPNMAPINRQGPEAITPSSPRRMNAPEVLAAIDGGATIVDGRPRHAYAAEHVGGSLNMELGESFAAWVGWLTPFGTPIVLVVDTEQDPAWARVELGRIGYDVIGFIDDLTGMPGLISIRTATVGELEQVIGEATVIDARDPAERAGGSVRDTIHRYVPDLRTDIPDGDGDVWIACASGYRAAIAAGLIERHGRTPVIIAEGGIPTLLQHRPDLRS
jgi:hydroxyacylglutathione hydrolase